MKYSKVRKKEGGAIFRGNTVSGSHVVGVFVLCLKQEQRIVAHGGDDGSVHKT